MNFIVERDFCLQKTATGGSKMALEAKVLDNIPWTGVKDWTGLTASYKRPEDKRESYVCEKDVDGFIAKLIQPISKKWNIPFDELKTYITSCNEAFFREKKKFFSGRSSCSKRDINFQYLMGTLKMPNVDDKRSISYLVFSSLSMKNKEFFIEKVKGVIFCKDIIEKLQRS